MIEHGAVLNPSTTLGRPLVSPGFVGYHRQPIGASAGRDRSSSKQAK
jgi:hypothetical protein